MSIKIYNGRRMKMDSLTELQKWLDDLRTMLHCILMDKVAKEMARRATYGYDLITASPNRENKIKNFVTNAWLEIRREFDECQRTKKRNPIVDVECDISMAFHDGYVYFVTFADNQQYIDAIDSLPEVEDYGYWDNTDKPSGISMKDWRERKDTWNKVSGNRPFYMAGLNWELVGARGIGIPLKETFESHIPTFGTRLKGMVKELVLSSYPGASGEKFDYATFMDALEWFRTSDDAKKLKEMVENNLKTILVKDLTYEILSGD